MDEMQTYEINDIYDYLPYAIKQQYEVARWINYYSIAPYLKSSDKEKPITKLFPLSTDAQEESATDEEEYEELSNEKIQQMKKQGAEIAKQLFNAAQS